MGEQQIGLTDEQIKALMEILPANITHARQAVYHYEQVAQPTESEVKDYWFYSDLAERLSAIRDKLTRALSGK